MEVICSHTFFWGPESWRLTVSHQSSHRLFPTFFFFYRILGVLWLSLGWGSGLGIWSGVARLLIIVYTVFVLLFTSRLLIWRGRVPCPFSRSLCNGLYDAQMEGGERKSSKRTCTGWEKKRKSVCNYCLLCEHRSKSGNAHAGKRQRV